LETIWFDTLPSTQTYLIESVKNGSLKAPICIAAHTQSEGIGSRGNKWEHGDGNLFFSFAVPLAQLPHDLKIESASVYFMYILKELLADKGSKCWVKWPNDIYIDEQKIGGAITFYDDKKTIFICGIGLNTTSKVGFGKCDIKVDKKSLLNEYLSIFRALPDWRDIFIKFQVEFGKTIGMSAYSKSFENSSDISLNDDGSLSVDNKKVFSLR
jgi:BirA family transcriptional regulator, biotin operon repressor / biotin---[acetyl-CoA-carboxylase] ligase